MTTKEQWQAIAPTYTDLSNPGFSEMDVFIFHGRCLSDSELGRDAFYMQGNEGPLHVVRSGRFIPAVAAPDFQLIVNSPIADALRRIGGVELRRIVLSRLVDLPDIRWNPVRQDALLKKCGVRVTAVSKIFARLPEYGDVRRVEPHFEVVPIFVGDAAPANGPASLSLAAEFAGRRKSVRVSAEVAKAHQVIASYPFWFMRDRPFDVLSPHLDDREFAVCPVECETL